jgi:DTW domain-containing protein YfiP
MPQSTLCQTDCHPESDVSNQHPAALTPVTATDGSKPHALARLRAQNLAKSCKPFLARGSGAPRCPRCRIKHSHCMCAFRPTLSPGAGVCLLMGDKETVKPSNTGWLIADALPDTYAFNWSRTEPQAELLALLNDPQWQAFVVYPAPDTPAHRLVVQPDIQAGRRPLFVLLDGTWSQASKMFRKSAYLSHLPVISFSATTPSRYGLRHAADPSHLCTAEVAAACLDLVGQHQAAAVLQAYLAVFTDHHLKARRGSLPDLTDATHQQLRDVCTQPMPEALCRATS